MRLLDAAARCGITGLESAQGSFTPPGNLISCPPQVIPQSTAFLPLMCTIAVSGSDECQCHKVAGRFAHLPSSRFAPMRAPLPDCLALMRSRDTTPLDSRI